MLRWREAQGPGVLPLGQLLGRECYSTGREGERGGRLAELTEVGGCGEDSSLTELLLGARCHSKGLLMRWVPRLSHFTGEETEVQ